MWVLAVKSLPVYFSNKESAKRFVSSIYLPCSSVVGAFKSTKAKRSEKTNLESNLLVHFISNINRSRCKEEDFSHFIKLCINQLSLLYEARFQMLHQVNHEVDILVIIPIVISMLMLDYPVLECKKLSKLVHELTEKKVGIYSSLNIRG